MTAVAPLPEAQAAKTARSTRYKWWVVFMLWFVCFFNYADRQAISSVLPLLSRDFGFDALELGLIGSAFAWVYAAVAPVAGIAADRIARKRLLIAACLLWSLFTLATGWCSGLAALVTVRALTGLSETFYFPAAMTLLSDYHSRRTRSRALSWHQSAVYAGTILGSWIAAVLAERLGWRFPFLLFGPVGILLAVVLAKYLREPQRGAAEEIHPSKTPALDEVSHPLAPASSAGAGGRSPGEGTSVPPQVAGSIPEARAVQRSNGEPPLSVMETLRLILRTPPALLLMGGFLCANFVAVIFLTWAPTFLVEKFHYAIGAAGLSGTLFIHLASALSVPVAGWLADRWVRRFAGGRMLVQVAGLLVGAAFVSLVGHTGNRTTLLVAMTCFGVCKGFYDSGIFASLYDCIEPRARGTAAGLMNTVGWGGGALGPLFVGLVSEYGHRATEVENMSDAIAFGGVIYLVAAGLILLALWFFVKSQRVAKWK